MIKDRDQLLKEIFVVWPDYRWTKKITTMRNKVVQTIQKACVLVIYICVDGTKSPYIDCPVEALTPYSHYVVPDVR